MEETVSIAKAFAFGSSSLAVIIPKQLRDDLAIQKGHHYLVKKDGANRIIYEPLDNKPADTATSLQDLLQRVSLHT